ncbi:phage major capsid protein [Kocuria flava]|uniref:phage major capsid protein n=1 Tax=Kocuria flava TaxID=446860 RepID=UPI002F948621
MNIEQLMAEAKALVQKHHAGTLTITEAERMNAVSAELRAARDAKAAAGPSDAEKEEGEKFLRALADHASGRKRGGDNGTSLTAASFKSAAGELATKIAGGDRQIATKTATVGNFDGSLIGTPVVELPARVPNVLSALPLTVAVDRFFDVMIQQSRTIRAGVVPEGGLKPESDIAYERRQCQLAVVAHTVSDVDEYVVQDVPLMQSLLNAEMVGGLWRTIEGQVLNGDENAGELPGILNASGIGLVAASAASPMLRLREAITLLESTDQAPGLIVLSPSQWAGIETAQATGSGNFLLEGSPVNAAQRRLWGVPVAVSSVMPENTGLVLDVAAVTLATDNRVKVNLGQPGDDFNRNLYTMRAETRVMPVVLRPAGVVKVDLGAAA